MDSRELINEFLKIGLRPRLTNHNGEYREFEVKFKTLKTKWRVYLGSSSVHGCYTELNCETIIGMWTNVTVRGTIGDYVKLLTKQDLFNVILIEVMNEK